MATNGSSTADVIINVYIDAQSLDQNALTVDITSVIIPSISDDDKVESDMAATLTKDLQKLAQRSLDYPRLEHLLGSVRHNYPTYRYRHCCQLSTSALKQGSDRLLQSQPNHGRPDGIDTTVCLSHRSITAWSYV